MVRESWLAHDNLDHEKFAAAAMLCESGSGSCVQDGFCHYDGQCFRRGRAAMSAACRAIENAANKQPDDIASEMRTAVTLLRRSWQAGEDIDSGRAGA